MNCFNNSLSRFFLLLALAGTMLTEVQAQNVDNPIPLADARVVRVTSPDAYVVRAGSEEQEALVAGAFVFEGDRLFSEDGTVVLSFSNGSNLVMQRGSDLFIETLRQEHYDEALGAYGALQADPSRSETRVFLSEGAVLGHVKQLRSDSVFRVETPIGTAGIRGTRFKVTLSLVENQWKMVLANFSGSVVLERTFTLDTGEVISDEISVVEGETVEYTVEVDIESDQYIADPVTSIIRSIRAAQEAEEDLEELEEADEESNEFQQTNAVSPPSTRNIPAPSSPPAQPNRNQVRTPTSAQIDTPDEVEEEEHSDDDVVDPPPPPSIEIPDHEVASPS